MKDFQKYIHISKYAKYIDNEKRRETWPETNEREKQFWISKYPWLVDDRDFLDAFDEMNSLNVMGSMRVKMTAGKALDRDNAAAYNCWSAAITHPRVFDELFYLLMCGGGTGFSVERQ